MDVGCLSRYDLSLCQKTDRMIAALNVFGPNVSTVSKSPLIDVFSSNR